MTHRLVIAVVLVAAEPLVETAVVVPPVIVEAVDRPSKPRLNLHKRFGPTHAKSSLKAWG